MAGVALRRGAAGDQGHLHAHDDERVEDRQGGRRADLAADAARHRHLRRRQARSGEAADRRQRRHPQGQEARRGEGDVVHLAGRPEDPGLVHHAAGLRRHEEVPDAAAHPRRPAQHVRRRLQLRLAGDGGQRLRDPLHQPARQHRLRQRVRQQDQQRLSEQGLRRPDGRRRRAAEEGLRRRAQHVRHRLQRRRRAHGVDRSARPIASRRRRRTAR